MRHRNLSVVWGSKVIYVGQRSNEVKTRYTVVAFLDLEKAYDSLWKRGIIFKLSESGINGKILKWIESFLKNRTFQVRVNGNLSENGTLKNGIPQGSVISPLLFNFMLNDLDELQNIINIWTARFKVFLFITTLLWNKNNLQTD